VYSSEPRGRAHVGAIANLPLVAAGSLKNGDRVERDIGALLTVAVVALRRASRHHPQSGEKPYGPETKR
jgi:hypothetical protein